MFVRSAESRVGSGCGLAALLLASWFSISFGCAEDAGGERDGTDAATSDENGVSSDAATVPRRDAGSSAPDASQAASDASTPEEGNEAGTKDASAASDAASSAPGTDEPMSELEAQAPTPSTADGVADAAGTPPESDGGSSSPSCEQCTQSVCALELEACADAANEGAVAQDATGNRCLAAVDCLQAPLSSGDYCTTLDGDVDTLSCACPVGMDALTCSEQDPAYLTTPQFECLPILRRAAVLEPGGGQPPASMFTLMLNYIDPETPVGDAMALMSCQLANCPTCEHVQP